VCDRRNVFISGNLQMSVSLARKMGDLTSVDELLQLFGVSQSTDTTGILRD